MALHKLTPAFVNRARSGRITKARRYGDGGGRYLKVGVAAAPLGGAPTAPRLTLTGHLARSGPPVPTPPTSCACSPPFGRQSPRRRAACVAASNRSWTGRRRRACATGTILRAGADTLR